MSFPCCGIMGERESYLREKLGKLDKKRAVLGGSVLLCVAAVLGYFGFSRPLIVRVPGPSGIYVKNNGAMDAFIHKVDVFWYWAGQVAVVVNLPEIHQRVERRAGPARLHVPDIPAPTGKIAQQGPCFMKFALHYRIPGIPIFRYIALFYFKYDPHRNAWAATKSIPAKYRSLGNLAVGNVGKIELSFH